MAIQLKQSDNRKYMLQLYIIHIIIYIYNIWICTAGKAVVYDEYVWVVGGFDNNADMYPEVQSIDTTNGNVRIVGECGGLLLLSVCYSASIRVDNLVYTFGGRTPTPTPSSTVTNEWQYCDTVPTPVPTNNHIPPTDNPSETPTFNPSDSPTNIPSTLPTYNPSGSPTNISSNAPTNIPSTLPTTNPSTIPTNIPSNWPTNNPSNTGQFAIG